MVESGEALFLGRNGQRIHVGKLTALVGKYVRRSAVGKSAACHLLRHDSATHMLRNGADIRYIQEFLGYKVITSTEMYTHATINNQQSTINNQQSTI